LPPIHRLFYCQQLNSSFNSYRNNPQEIAFDGVCNLNDASGSDSLSFNSYIHTAIVAQYQPLKGKHHHCSLVSLLSFSPNQRIIKYFTAFASLSAIEHVLVLV